MQQLCIRLSYNKKGHYRTTRKISPEDELFLRFQNLFGLLYHRFDIVHLELMDLILFERHYCVLSTILT